MTTEWVDFKKVKAAVSIQMVLDHYNVKGLSKSGEELRGPCPIHKGSTRSKNFSVNLTKNAFKCFASDCKAKGNVLDFVAAMERCDIREAALKLADWFKIGESEPVEAAVESPSNGENETIAVTRGIYADLGGELFEVIATALSGETSEQLVVYRELYGEYQFRVAPPESFGERDCRFTLVKTL